MQCASTFLDSRGPKRSNETMRRTAALALVALALVAPVGFCAPRARAGGSSAACGDAPQRPHARWRACAVHASQSTAHAPRLAPRRHTSRPGVGQRPRARAPPAEHQSPQLPAPDQQGRNGHAQGAGRQQRGRLCTRRGGGGGAGTASARERKRRQDRCAQKVTGLQCLDVRASASAHWDGVVCGGVCVCGVCVCVCVCVRSLLVNLQFQHLVAESRSLWVCLWSSLFVGERGSGREGGSEREREGKRGGLGSEEERQGQGAGGKDRRREFKDRLGKAIKGTARHARSHPPTHAATHSAKHTHTHTDRDREA